MRIGSHLKVENYSGMVDSQKVILTVTTDLNYDQRMQRICQSLQHAGYYVVLVGREKHNSLDLKTANYSQHRLRLPFEKGILFYLVFNLYLFFYLLRNPAKIICAVDLDSVLAVGLIKKLRPSVKCVFDAHEYFTEVPELQGRKMVQRIWNLIGDYFVPSFDAAYTVGPALASIFSKRYNLEFQTIRNLSVQRDYDIERKVDKPFVVYYQGALNAGRGLEQIVKAMKYLGDAFKLQIAGEGDLSDHLRAIVKQEGLEKQIEFLGYLRPVDLLLPLQSANLGLNLLENKGLSYYYSLANKTFDYIQAELPALHMEFPEYSALQQEWNCFYLIKELDPKRIAQCIEEIAFNESDYLAKVEACRKAKNDLNWASEAQKLEAIYKGL
jgi:glycosyltransferase involved in cell wall biosynthesis